MDPFGTPALTGNQFDDCSLSITRWNLLLRKLLISAWASPEIPTYLSLQIMPNLMLNFVKSF